MGGGRTETRVVESGSQTVQPTAEERELQRIQLGQLQEFDPQQRSINRLGGELVQQLLSGGDLPGNLAPLSAGITEEQAADLSQSALRDLNVFLAGQGAGTFLESGASQAIGARTAGDIRRNVVESNLNRLLNLLNLSIGAPAAIQDPALSTSAQLSQRLAGLRGVTTTGQRSALGPTLGQSFGQSFASGLGSTFGSPRFGFGSQATGGVGFGPRSLFG